MRDAIKDTICTLAECLSHIRSRYLYTFNTEENFCNAKAECQQAVEIANTTLNGYCISAVLHFERINDGIDANIDFVDTVTGHPLDLSHIFIE